MKIGAEAIRQICDESETRLWDIVGYGRDRQARTTVMSDSEGMRVEVHMELEGGYSITLTRELTEEDA